MNLDEYWSRPLPPNGDPPVSFSELEASLDPKSCGSCHVNKYEEWKNSMHSKTITSGIMWQFKLMDQASANNCMDCHSPLAEQKALMALNVGYKQKPTKPIPEYVSSDLHKSGVICAACHIRKHKRYGPPKELFYDLKGNNNKPHEGCISRSYFKDSKFCAACHQFPDYGPKTSGKLRMNTYKEWIESPYSKKGISCQSCHMPNGRHVWYGINNREFVLNSIYIEVWINEKEKTLYIKVKNMGAGHNFPTYMVPKIYVKVYQSGREILKGTIGWMVDEFDLDREFFDSRIPPLKSVTFKGNITELDDSINLKVIVDPKEHYYRAFKGYLSKNQHILNEEITALLKESIERTVKLKYTLLDVNLDPIELINKKKVIIQNGERKF